jgi:hypothetical protein
MRSRSGGTGGLLVASLVLAACSAATTQVPTNSTGSTPPTASTPSPAPSPELTTPGFVITPVTVTDLPAASSVTYDTVTTTGLSPDAAVLADAAVKEITDVNIDEWRATTPADCTLTPAPCGQWEQKSLEVPCIDPYLCLLVEGNGVFPGAATSSESVGAVAIDPASGTSAQLAQALGTASVDDLLGFLTEKVARFQTRRFDIPCDDSTHVSRSPLTAKMITTWLPTQDGIKVWFEKYAIAPGSAGVVPMLVTWDELAHADDFAELGRTSCSPTNVDADGLPVLTQGGAITAGGILCPAKPGDLPDLTPGVDAIRATRVVQIVLQSYGMYSGPLDGKYLPSTQKAVREFQQNSSVVVDGLVGPKTWNALKSSYCRNWG